MALRACLPPWGSRLLSLSLISSIQTCLPVPLEKRAHPNPRSQQVAQSSQGRAERPRDSHKGKDGDDGNREEQLDGDDGVDLEQTASGQPGSAPHSPGPSPAPGPRAQKTLPLSPSHLLVGGRGPLLNSEGSTLST